MYIFREKSILLAFGQYELSKVGHRAHCRGERALNKDTSSATQPGLGRMAKNAEETNSID